ncbi:MAG: TIGR04255 family protein [Chloroflexus sp.]|nr:TIGR04255 family protein [Chloroflexus sp.]
MGRTYANPPIVEVVCEFRLSQETLWDLALPGLIYEKLRDQFPHREQRLLQEFGIEQSSEGIRQEIRTSERILFFTDDRRMFVQVGPRLIAVNCLKPYPTWAHFKPIIVRTWQHVIDTVAVRGIDRIGLRYINQIELAHVQANLADLFQFYPYLGPHLPRQMSSFLIGSEFVFHEQRDRCRVQLMSLEIDSPVIATVLLDIDYFLARSNGVAVDRALDWVETAHSEVEAIFEGCITDQLRALFGEGKA